VSADINYNTKINSKMKAVFCGKVYDVGVPDNYEFKKEKTRVLLTLSSDKNKYTLEDEFDE
jgi:SPP1 family predicted phage head-tail adaptor